ncbi:MAG: DNA photolyase [Candidatus Eremiobacteraeota bacterium]|nr:DNA photolyase [Candidatus Eremiobacteraeota bacterium]
MLFPSFSHIYVEQSARGYPATDALLARFPKASQIAIEDYKEVFNRGYQAWRLQKKSPKLILAARREEFLYPCSDIAPSFGHPHFYYNTLMLNCIYDCDYCYLQGTYPSANLVMFVNLEDYFKATDAVLARHPMYLCISYDTDLLGLESVYPYARQWIEYARTRPELLIEIRTKSANYRLLRDVAPCANVVLAWTLSPQPVAERFEPLTPGLAQRLKSMQQAAADGWPVRLCLDPLLKVPDWRRVYLEFLDQLEAELDWSRLRDASVGVFRMNRDFLKRIRRQRQDSPIIHYPYVQENRIVSYDSQTRSEMVELVRERLANLLGKEKVVVV